MKQMNSINRVLEGSPSKILQELSAEMINTMQTAGIIPSGVQALAMAHALVAMIKGGQNLYAQHPEVGLMPSFKAVLSVLSHGLSGSNWTAEEQQEFDDEFGRIVESLGGRRMGKDEPRSTQAVNLVSGNLGSC